MESHSWTVTNYLRENNFKWDFTDLPKSPNTNERAGLTFVNGYSSYNGTKFPKESVKLIDFWYRPGRRSRGAWHPRFAALRRSMAAVWTSSHRARRRL